MTATAVVRLRPEPRSHDDETLVRAVETDVTDEPAERGIESQ